MSPQLRLSIALAIVFGTYAASTVGTGVLVQWIYEFDCAQSYFNLQCAFPPDSAHVGPAYPVLALLLLLFAIAAWLFGRKRSAYPFLMFSVALCGAALLWDMLVLKPIIFGPKIINDTINILRAVIAASFVLLLVLCRAEQYSLRKLVTAVVSSYGLTALSVTAFVELSQSVFGVTELFLLYVIYAFGSFSLHLMTVSRFVITFPQRSAGALA